MPERLLVVFDANVLIPMIIPASHSARLLLRLHQAGHKVATSPQIIEETREKMLTKERLRQWLGVSDQEIERFLDRLPTVCFVVPGVRQAHGAVPADPKDDMVIATALESDASYIISEDKHLLDLGQYQGIKIMNREQFAAELDRLGVE